MSRSLSWSASGAQRRPGERPGNRAAPDPSCRRTNGAQRRPGERPGNRRPAPAAPAGGPLRSTKAGRKARQPPVTVVSSTRITAVAQRRPGERPGNRRRTRTWAQIRWRPLNEGRAKGPATAGTDTPVGLSVSCAQRRPGERPGNRALADDNLSERNPALNEGRAKGPATARPPPGAHGGAF